jgi:hypothetical protein
MIDCLLYYFQRLYESLAWRLQGSLKFFRVEYDSNSGSADIFSFAGINPDQTPIILLVTAKADTKEETNRFAGPWDSTSDASSASGQSLRDWFIARKLPLISELDQSNFDDITGAGKKIVLAVVDAKNKGCKNGAEVGKAFVDSLYPLARLDSFKEKFIFAWVDGPRFNKYVSQFGVTVSDPTSGPADTSSLPSIVVLEPDQDYYYPPPSKSNGLSHPIGNVEDVKNFLQAVIDGNIKTAGTIPWYNPSRYIKLLEKQLDTMPTWQIVLVVVGFFLSLLGSLYWCCMHGLDSALGLTLTPEEEAELAKEKERAKALAKKKDGGKSNAAAPSTSSSAAAANEEKNTSDEGLKQRKGK